MANEVKAINGIGIVDVQELNGVENSTSNQNMEKLNGSTWEYGGTTVTEAIPKTGESTFSDNDDSFTYDAVYQVVKVLNDYRALIMWTAGSSGTGGKTFIKVARAASGGTTISYGTKAQVNATGAWTSGIGGLDVDLITNNKALVTAQDEDDSNKGKAYVITISGTPATSVSVGTAATYEADATAWSTVAADRFTADKYVIVYDHTGDGEIQAKVCTVSGTTPSFGSAAVVADMSDYSGVTDIFYPYVEADPFNTGRYLVAWNLYNSTSGAFRQRLTIMSVSGTTITVGTSVEIQNGSSKQGATWDKRTKNRIFCVVLDNEDSGKAKITPCSVEDTVNGDGKTITKGGTQYTYYSTAGCEEATVVTDYYIPNIVLMSRGRGASDEAGGFYSAPATGLTLGTIATEDADFISVGNYAAGLTSASDPFNAGWFWGAGRQEEGFIRAGILGGTY